MKSLKHQNSNENFETNYNEDNQSLILNNDNAKKGLRFISINDLVNMDFPIEEMLIEPIIPTQSLGIIYAPTGVGKTFLSISIALSVASGKPIFGKKWQAKKKAKVLFIDGEMAGRILQERFKNLAVSNNIDINELDLYLLPTAIQENSLPDLSLEKGQEEIEKYIVDDVKLIILDNLSTLFRSGKENDEDSWKITQNWLIKLRSKGISVLLIHHTGKNGGQRGTSKKMDVLDYAIKLSNPSDYSNSDGVRIKVGFDKNRQFYGEDAKPFELQLNDYVWEVSECELDELETQIIDLYKSNEKKPKGEKMTQKDMAKKLNTSEAKITRVIKYMKKSEGKK